MSKSLSGLTEDEYDHLRGILESRRAESEQAYIRAEWVRLVGSVHSKYLSMLAINRDLSWSAFIEFWDRLDSATFPSEVDERLLTAIYESFKDSAKTLARPFGLRVSFSPKRHG